ncbi:MAG TPA: DUF6194 family protein [Ktedonobacterales bacterium]
MKQMDQDAIIQYISETFTGLEILRPADGPGAGDTFIYYDPQRAIDPAHRLPVVTIVTKDYGEYDNASRLNRPGVFRLNIGVGRETFRALLGFAPNELGARRAGYDFAALDQLMPHPLYGEQGWVCALNPSAATFEAIKPLLADAYARAADQYARHQTKAD